MKQQSRGDLVQTGDGTATAAIPVFLPVSARVITAAAALITIGIVTALSLGHYTRSAHGSGILLPAGGLIQLTAVARGTVSRVTVRQGDAVRVDDSLITISSERTSASIGKTDATITEQLTLQRQRTDADLNDLSDLERARAAARERSIGILAAQLAQIQAMLKIRRLESQNARNFIEKITSTVAKGTVSGMQLLQLERDALESEAQVVALKRQHLEVEQQLASARSELLELPLTVAAQRRDLERRRADIDQALAQNEVQRASVLRAPQDGNVAAILVVPGENVQPGQALLAIVPKNSILVAQIFIASRSAGFVAPGRRVALRYQAYPYQKFGLHTGRVINVSESALSPEQVSALLGRSVQEPMYRVEVDLDSQTVDTYGTAERLKPGMALDAEIQVDRRTLLEWLFEPLFSASQRLLRHSA
jgi:membrane fusion protein